MRRVTEAARFGLVGALAFVVDVGTFNLLRLVSDLGPLTSKTLAVVVATTFAYAANRWWAFSHRESRLRPTTEYALFFALNGIGLLITLGCLGFAYYLLGLTSALAQNVSANVVGLALSTVFRFWAYRRWVFTQPVAVESEPEPVPEPAPELARSA